MNEISRDRLGFKKKMRLISHTVVVIIRGAGLLLSLLVGLLVVRSKPRGLIMR